MTRLTLAALVLISAGCRSIEVQIDTYLDHNAAGRPPGQTSIPLEAVALVPNAEAENPLLDRELLAHLGTLLEARGVASVPPEEALYGLIASTSLSDPLSSQVSTPVWQPSGTFFASVGGPGGPALTPVTRVGPAWTSGSRLRFTSRLSLMLFELEPYRESGHLEPVWIGNGRHFGRSSDLRTLARALAIPLIDYLGADTGRQISVTIDP